MESDAQESHWSLLQAAATAWHSRATWASRLLLWGFFELFFSAPKRAVSRTPNTVTPGASCKVGA